MEDVLSEKGHVDKRASKAEMNGPGNSTEGLAEQAQPAEPGEGLVPAAELESARKDLLYLRAEFDNYRKQALKERAALLRYGGEALVMDLLNVLDNFERALSTPNNPENYSAFREGVELTAQQFRDALKNHGICEVASEGKIFDPTVHEALSSIASPDHDAGAIIQVYRRAYSFHDKLIRPALVVVASEKP